jgi:AraC family transcriptional regulator, transcriptional activator FtrA
MPQSVKRPQQIASKLVVALAYDGVNAFELGIATEIFGLTSVAADWYGVAVCAERPGQPLLTGSSVRIVADAGLELLGQAHTVIVPGWRDIDLDPPAPLLDALRKAHAQGIRIASICSGVFILAAAGLLDGRRAAVHWANADALAQRYPAIRVDRDVLYVDEGDILTSAGRAAGLDLCLHIVRRDHGTKIANDVARRLVIAPHRDGGQAQFIPRPVPKENDPLRDILTWAQGNLQSDLSIAILAEKAGMSRRTFIRRFGQATGASPGDWVLQARMSEACRLLEATELPIERIATETGFGSADTLRHHFKARLYTSPARYRSSFAARQSRPICETTRRLAPPLAGHDISSRP